MKKAVQDRRQHPRANRSRGGFSLIEVAWSCLLLTVLGLATGSFATFGQTMTEVLATKRSALEAANSRIEDIRGTRYSDVAPVAQSYQTNYLSRSGASWTRSLGDPGETVRINARTCPIVTTIQYADLDGGTISYDGVRVNVCIRHSPGAAGTITLEAILVP